MSLKNWKSENIVGKGENAAYQLFLISPFRRPASSGYLKLLEWLWFQQLNFFPDNKILGLPKLKAFADNKLNVTQNIKGVFYRLENIVGKEENAGYHFLLFPQCFQMAFSSRASKVVDVW